MSGNEQDPGADTEMFQRFVEQSGSERSGPSVGSLVAIAVVVVLVVAVAIVVAVSMS